jgi:hypothetical protein
MQGWRFGHCRRAPEPPRSGMSSTAEAFSASEQRCRRVGSPGRGGQVRYGRTVFMQSTRLVELRSVIPSNELAPKNCSSSGTRSRLDRPCRYSGGSTSATFGARRHQRGSSPLWNCTHWPADRHLSVCGGAAGSCTVTWSPPAGRGVRVRVPSCAWVMLLTIARPRPTSAWSVRRRSVPR